MAYSITPRACKGQGNSTNIMINSINWMFKNAHL